MTKTYPSTAKVNSTQTVITNGSIYTSVSRRISSSYLEELDPVDGGDGGPGCFLQLRTMSTTAPSPANRKPNGMTHATRPNPTFGGAARIVGPYFCTKACKMRSSLSPR